MRRPGGDPCRAALSQDAPPPPALTGAHGLRLRGRGAGRPRRRGPPLELPPAAPAGGKEEQEEVCDLRTGSRGPAEKRGGRRGAWRGAVAATGAGWGGLKAGTAGPGGEAGGRPVSRRGRVK